MITGKRICLRPIRDDDWQIIETWAHGRDSLWGPYQRFQLDHLPALRQEYQEGGLLTREAGMLLIETLQNPHVVGFIRYTLIPYPDDDFTHPEIGFGITDLSARRQGYAREATALLVEYLFGGYAAERISAFTDAENIPVHKILESLHFKREGVLRRSYFRDGEWHDMFIYSLLRNEV